MPDFSPWGAAAQSGMGAYNYPQPVSGVGANTLPFQQYQQMTPPPPQAPQAQALGGAMGGAPGIGGGRFNPMGQPTGIGQGGMNPLMGFLLPFLMLRMGLGGAQGGAMRPPMQGIQGNSPAGGTLGGGSLMNPGGNMPQGNAFGIGGGMPPQTKSPFDIYRADMSPQSLAPPMPTGIPMSLQTQMNTGNMMPPPQAPPPQRIMQGEGGPGKTSPATPPPPTSPEAQMQQQSQQAQLNNSLSQIAMNNPTMAALLRQQLMGQLGY